MPSVNDQHHDSLMNEVKEHLKVKGYSWYEADYGTVAGDSCKNTLLRRTTPSAVFLRTRADRIACRHDGEFEFDAKTKQNDYADIAVEALPLVHHSLVFTHFGLPCLYAFRWVKLPDYPDVGCFIDMEFCKTVDAIWLFTWREDMARVNDWMRLAQPNFFPNAELLEYSQCRGSGDPMAIVNASKVEQMAHWKTCIP